MSMKTIRLSGRLANKFESEYRLDVHSPAEAIRALCYQLPEFEEELKKGQYRVYRTKNGKRPNAIGEEAINLSFGSADGLRITPVAAGAKKRGLGKVILGIVLVSAAFFSGGTALQGIAGATGISTSQFATFGAVMALQGISSMLTPDNEETQQEESSLMDVTGNRMEQGQAVPLLFGEVFAGSVIISAGITSESIVSGSPNPTLPSGGWDGIEAKHLGQAS